MFPSGAGKPAVDPFFIIPLSSFPYYPHSLIILVPLDDSARDVFRSRRIPFFLLYFCPILIDFARTIPSIPLMA